MQILVYKAKDLKINERVDRINYQINSSIEKNSKRCHRLHAETGLFAEKCY